MTTQLDLLQRPPPAQRHSQPSIEAAARIEPSADTLRGVVLEYLRGYPNFGATDEEMQVGLEMNPSTQRPRRIELVRMGLVWDTGTTRQTLSGRKATVWRAV